MYSLLLALLASSAIALLFKQSDRLGLNKYYVTLGNYLTASIIAYLMMESKLLGTIIEIPTLMTGLVTGVLFLASFGLYQYSVSRYGAALSGMYGKLGILVPMLLSLGLFKESLSFVQIIGIGVALMAIGLVIEPKGKVREVHIGLIGLFLVGGLGEFGNKVFQYVGNPDDKPLFLFLVFSVAGLLCLALIVFRRQPLDFASMIFGTFVGIANLLSSYFLIDSLNVLPGSIAFPIYSAGAIALIALGSHFIFGEKLSGRQKISMLVSMLALWLVNQ